MNAQRSAGHLSRVMWGDVDLQIQTELRFSPSAQITTILVAEGEVISRIKKDWKTTHNQVEDQNNVNEYHARLTRAIGKLNDKGWVSLKELPVLADRLVEVALRFFDESITAEACSMVPGVRWAALIDSSNRLVDGAPSQDLIRPWKEAAEKMGSLLKTISAVFKTESLHEMTFNTGDGIVLVLPKNSTYFISEIEPQDLRDARILLKQMVASS